MPGSLSGIGHGKVNLSPCDCGSVIVAGPSLPFARGRFRYSPNSVVTLGVLTVSAKHRCPIEVLHRRVRLVRYYLQYSHASRNPRSAFRLRLLAKSAWRARVLPATPLSLWCCVHFRTWWSLFMAGTRDTSCFGGPKSTFRDRCKGWERLYFEVQTLGLAVNSPDRCMCSE